MSQKTTAKDDSVRPKTISVILTAEASARLTEVARKAGRSRQLEVMLRIHDSLKHIPEIMGDPREITTL